VPALPEPAYLPVILLAVYGSDESGAGDERQEAWGGGALPIPQFDFEYGRDIAGQIEPFNPTFWKVLVRYNPECDKALNRLNARIDVPPGASARR
jgi:hypothetical protein